MYVVFFFKTMIVKHIHKSQIIHLCIYIKIKSGSRVYADHYCSALWHNSAVCVLL